MSSTQPLDEKPRRSVVIQMPSSVVRNPKRSCMLVYDRTLWVFAACLLSMGLIGYLMGLDDYYPRHHRDFFGNDLDAHSDHSTAQDILGSHNKRKRNFIFMVSDGFGPASQTFARSFQQYLQGDERKPGFELPLDTILVGTSRTKSYDSLVTDSAAGATAFSCGSKTYNGGIAVNSTRVPCVTVLEVAKASGYYTGMVVRSKITDATPGSFSAHVLDRGYQNEIAAQQVGSNTPFGRSLDLMMGAGGCHFMPNSTVGSCRKDDRNLLEEAAANGFKTFVNDRTSFDKLTGVANELPVIGLLAPNDLNYEFDRDAAVEPSLKEQAEIALKLLTDASTKDSESKGFFLLIEGSNIDIAAHYHDAAAHAHEILAYNEVIALVKSYVDAHPGTVMLSTSDHETGGLSLARQDDASYPIYEWKPSVIAKVKKSSSNGIGKLIFKIRASNRAEVLREYIFPELIGITDFTQAEIEYLSNEERTLREIQMFTGNLIAKRALINFATEGHSGTDVNVYAYAGMDYQDLLRPVSRNQENTDLFNFMTKILKLDGALIDQMQSRLVKAAEEGTLVMVPEKSIHGDSTSDEMPQEHDFHKLSRKN